jgi:CubicO group peptidase (beta-lactamase class C family)
MQEQNGSWDIPKKRFESWWLRAAERSLRKKAESMKKPRDQYHALLSRFDRIRALTPKESDWQRESAILLRWFTAMAMTLFACPQGFVQTVGNPISEKIMPRTGIVFHEYTPYDRTAGIAAVQHQRLIVENFLHATSLNEWRWTFNHPECFYTSIGISRKDSAISAFEYAPRNLNSLTFKDSSGQETSLGEFIRSSYTDGFLVIYKGKISTEEYFNGFTPSQPHQFASVWKSATGMLAAALVDQGYLRWEHKVSKYVPEMTGSAYADVSIGQLVDMASGISYDANAATNPEETGSTGVGNLERLPKIRQTFAQPGENFNYNSLDAELVGWVLMRATGKELPTLFSEYLWSRIGAEVEARSATDVYGYMYASGIGTATLRDLGRLGCVHARRGKNLAGDQIIPESFYRRLENADTKYYQNGHKLKIPALNREESTYSTFHWLPRKGVIAMLGYGDQAVIVIPKDDLVVVKLSSFPSYLGPGAGEGQKSSTILSDSILATEAIANSLRPMAEHK